MSLLSPLVIYASRGVIPLAALYAIAGGIALMLALTGRRLHAALLADGGARREPRGQAVLVAGMTLLVVMLVLLGAVVALLLALREALPSRAV